METAPAKRTLMEELRTVAAQTLAGGECSSVLASCAARRSTRVSALATFIMPTPFHPHSSLAGMAGVLVGATSAFVNSQPALFMGSAYGVNATITAGAFFGLRRLALHVAGEDDPLLKRSISGAAGALVGGAFTTAVSGSRAGVMGTALWGTVGFVGQLAYDALEEWRAGAAGRILRDRAAWNLLSPVEKADYRRMLWRSKWERMEVVPQPGGGHALYGTVPWAVTLPEYVAFTHARKLRQATGGANTADVSAAPGASYSGLFPDEFTVRRVLLGATAASQARFSIFPEAEGREEAAYARLFPLPLSAAEAASRASSSAHAPGDGKVSVPLPTPAAAASSGAGGLLPSWFPVRIGDAEEARLAKLEKRLTEVEELLGERKPGSSSAPQKK